MRLGAIFAGPYIKRLIKGMGLEDQLHARRLSVILPLGMDTLWLMGMVVHHDFRWILTPSHTEQLPVGGEEVDEESGNKSDIKSSFPSATAPTSAACPEVARH